MSSAQDIAAFFDRQLYLLQEEKAAEISESNVLLSNCSPKLLEQKGLALTNLVPLNIQVGMAGRRLVELGRSPAFSVSATLPPHNFRPGDMSRIEGPSSHRIARTKGVQDNNSVDGVIYKVTDSRIVIAIDSLDLQGSEDAELPNICNLIKLANTITNDRMQEVMAAVKMALCNGYGGNATGTPIHSETMAVTKVLLGIEAPSKVADLGDLDFYDASLNDSQKQSIRFALGCVEFACIHGPPGTGKTHTLLEIIRQTLYPRFAQHGTHTTDPPKKILVCGASNLAVDNILERLLLPPLPGIAPIKCTRVGHPARVKGQARSLDETLDAQSARSEQAGLIKDIKDELSESLLLVAGKAKGQKGKKPRAEERRKIWDEIKQLRREFRKRERGIVSSVLADAQVVLATCHSSGGRTLDNMLFDVVIIDEATQALEAACWIPITKGKKLILAGDPLQLPPTVLSQTKQAKADAKPKLPRSAKRAGEKSASKSVEKKDGDKESSADSDADNSLSENPISPSDASHMKSRKLIPSKDLSVTLFERLEKTYGASIKTMLEIQYRMHDKICQFPSKMLYGSRLRSDKSVASHVLLDLDNARKDSPELLSAPVVFLDTSGCEYFEKNVEKGDDGSKYNENEAMLVKAWLEKSIDAGIHPYQIAVITPYQGQVVFLSSILSSTYGSELEIGTVDGMQGREKEAIIISLVRSNDKREVGFLKEKRRLNVAMTRARRHMCVIGDSSTVQHGGNFLKKWMAWLEDSAEVYYGGLEELP